jgi:bacillolysin
MRVYDFYNSVLMHSGIDGNGSEIVSNVNCVSSRQAIVGQPKEWRNAAWWLGRMWYGQVEQSGVWHSYSRYLDVIAHELTHGVTAATSGLVYREQSGALSESFSDIFGVMVHNWSKGRTAIFDDWTWEIGSGLGGNGLPLRDLRDPARTHHPAHMKQYVVKPVTRNGDWGGVHTNSGILNRAAYNVMASKDGKGHAYFTLRDVAVIYYSCLIRLNSTATFNGAFTILIDVANTYLSADSKRAEKVAAIEDAYRQVGIPS